jgi:hypothetical protein
MSADGLWSFALMNICQIAVLFYALVTAPVMSADHEVFALMNI